MNANNDSNNSNNNNSKNIFEKGGFPVLLCSGIAVLIVSTLYFSYSGYDNKGDDNLEQDNLSVNSSDVKSYEENILLKNILDEDTDNYYSTENSKNINSDNTELENQNILAQNNEEYDYTILENLILENDTDTTTQENQESTENITDIEDNSNNTTDDTKKVENTNNTEDTSDKENSSETSSTQNNSEASNFNLFDVSKEMTWPVSGQIVMNYSTDTAIYDKTLDLYRTNDSICISAPEGTDVLASADGIIEKIFVDNEKGNSVVINHGNGWISTYSQLTENLNVSVGQVVDMGEQIGQVSLPSNYSVLLGPHLDFTVKKDDLSSDPLLVLAQIE